MAGAEKSHEIREVTPATLETNKEQSPKEISDATKNKGGEAILMAEKQLKPSQERLRQYAKNITLEALKENRARFRKLTRDQIFTEINDIVINKFTKLGQDIRRLTDNPVFVKINELQYQISYKRKKNENGKAKLTIVSSLPMGTPDLDLSDENTSPVAKIPEGSSASE